MCIRDRGYTIADYDYAEMPQVSDGQWTVIIKAEYSSYEGLRFTSNAVSYTHLDVYKRQGSNVGKGNWSKIEVAHKGNSITYGNSY